MQFLSPPRGRPWGALLLLCSMVLPSSTVAAGDSFAQAVQAALERARALRLAGSETAQSERQWESAKQLENDVRRRFKAGELARADLLLAQQESLDREATYQEALATL